MTHKEEKELIRKRFICSRAYLGWVLHAMEIDQKNQCWSNLAEAYIADVVVMLTDDKIKKAFEAFSEKGPGDANSQVNQ